MYFYTVQLRKMGHMDKEPKTLVDMTFLDDRDPTKERMGLVFSKAADVVLEVYRKKENGKGKK